MMPENSAGSVLLVGVEDGLDLGLTGSAVKSAIWRLRQRHRDRLREEIAHTVATPAGVDGEIRHFLNVFGG